VSTPFPLLPGYRITEELIRSTACVLFRGIEAADGSAVLLKRPARVPLTPWGLAALRREYDLLGEVAVDALPSRVELVPPYLVLADAGYHPLSRVVTPGTASVEQCLAVTRALVLALGALHASDLVHRGLRLDTVLMRADLECVQLVDSSTISRMRATESAISRGGSAANEVVSPEQTGLVNRTVDYRADFYALGLVVYELLTGHPPFETSDPQELVHWHIARAPVAPQMLSSRIPHALSDIVLKLLAKMPEDRYQSVGGLLADLERCAALSQQHDFNSTFPLGTREAARQLSIPPKLYGRARELEQLFEAFDQAASGSARFLFISGPAGVGKTSVARELEPRLAARGGRLVTGKFDRIDRSTPYSALARALGDLCGQLGAEQDQTRARTVERLRTRLGTQVHVLVSLVPELGVLLGERRGAPAAGVLETQNRLVAAFESLLGAVATSDTPLVVFLDDLQWADMATLRLLTSTLTSQPELPVLWLAAFRDDEVHASHPVSRFLADLRGCEAPTSHLMLAPLGLSQLSEFLEAALGQSRNRLTQLAELVQQKTNGNPFFVVQLLKALEGQQLLRFDEVEQAWTYDLARVEAAGITSDVLDLMTRKLGHLLPTTRRALTIAACIGSRFNLDTLAMLRGDSRRAAADDLWEAMREGLIIAERPDYEVLVAAAVPGLEPVWCRFLHDRVQQAAHDWMPAQERAELRLELGRSLLTASGDSPEMLFDIVGHLNQVHHLIEDEGERQRLATLNLAAGRRARAAAAVQQALELFEAGERLVANHGPSDLGWALTIEAAECEFICGSSDAAEGRLTRVLEGDASDARRVQALTVRIGRYENVGRFEDAVNAGLEALSRLGCPIPRAVDTRQILLDEENATIERLLAACPVESLPELPEIQDERSKLRAQLMLSLWPSAFLLNSQHLTALLSAMLVRITLEQGQSDASALGFITYAIFFNERHGEFARGNQLGSVGLALGERCSDPFMRVKVQHLYASFLASWSEPFARTEARGLTAHRAALELGDFTHAARAAFMSHWYAFFGDSRLTRFEERAREALVFLKRVRHEMIERALEVLLTWARVLRGSTHSPKSLCDDGDQRFESLRQAPVLWGFLSVAQLHLSLSFGDDERAWEWAEQAERALAGSARTVWHSHLDLFRGLLICRREGRGARDRVQPLLARLAAQAAACPSNYAHHHRLLLAAAASAEGDFDGARDAYFAATSLASASGQFGTRALTHEWALVFFIARGETLQAREQLEATLECYEAWGATAKVSALSLQHQALLETRGQPSAARVQDFDALSALKAAQAIAAELELDKLLPRLMRIVIENAGAERGVLIDVRGAEPEVLAEGVVAREASAVSPPEPLAARRDVPQALVRRVLASREALLVADATRDEALKQDGYVLRAAPRAILCLPLLRQGSLLGVLYLENTLSADVFSPGRLEVVRALAAQAAISLENARLYTATKQEVARRAEAEDALKRALADLHRLQHRLVAENVYLNEEIQTQQNFREIVGQSPALLDALAKVERVAATDSTVLIHGETGTGKELIARAIHESSKRSRRTLVKVNCAALASTLFESELFGHVKGAFTGALQKRVGRFELADGGTIFLDEVGELPLEVQTKLLRVLQEREFEPVGSSQTRRVDVRIVAATNRNLNEAVARQVFRADLLYRLNVFPIRVPPLRERAEDVRQLAALFLERQAARLGKDLESFSGADLERLERYPWPGNVRELENVVERAAILAHGRTPRLDAHFAELTEAPAAPASEPEVVQRTSPAAPVVAPAAALPAATPRSLSEVERQHIVRTLELTSWVVEGAGGAAMVLGMHPNTLRSRMKKLGIVRSAKR